MHAGVVSAVVSGRQRRSGEWEVEGEEKDLARDSVDKVGFSSEVNLEPRGTE